MGVSLWIDASAEQAEALKSEGAPECHLTASSLMLALEALGHVWEHNDDVWGGSLDVQTCSDLLAGSFRLIAVAEALEVTDVSPRVTVGLVGEWTALGGRVPLEKSWTVRAVGDVLAAGARLGLGVCWA